ncbi:hypothetical protein KDW_30290 [Dictyobacter vulcani]|uniref:Esterase n=1 Tax=Dictyobacter vulcani TaxID=2607529 RepID=A0A5J4KR89_9CHLR|nr:alpha/beta hydrolase-fold protein [Dictyobacter vulcani]GER88867.1 hypothetical protein KDW_30290 [Dictyobacter vulcani]
MKQKQIFTPRWQHNKWLIPILWFFVSFLVALLSGFFLFRHTVYDELTATLITTSLDAMRSQLIAALLLTALAAIIGALLTNRKMGAVLGATVVFILRYMITFIQTELIPVTDAGGHIKPLQPDALNHTTLMMGALAILSAFIGSAIGASLYEIFVKPPALLIHNIWQHYVNKQDLSAQTTHSMSIQGNIQRWHLERWIALFIMIGLFFLASQSGNLFIISPDADLHSAPLVGTANSDVPAFGHTQILKVRSKLLGNRMRQFEIYLPPSYNTAVGKNKRYPTAYLLHGSPGQPVDWIIAGKAAESADTLIDTKKISELILVMPDGNGAPGATSEWGNSGNGKQPIEDYVSKELVKYIDQHYRTIPDADHRAIGGLSMGGFGAMNIAIHHYDVFHWVVALGGYYKADGTIWGPSQAYRQYNSPIIQIGRQPQAQKLHMFLGDATEDKAFYSGMLRYAQVVHKLHVNYLMVTEHGGHSWKVWTDQMYKAFTWISWGPLHQAPKAVKKS